MNEWGQITGKFGADVLTLTGTVFPHFAGATAYFAGTSSAIKATRNNNLDNSSGGGGTGTGKYTLAQSSSTAADWKSNTKMAVKLTYTVASSSGVNWATAGSLG